MKEKEFYRSVLNKTLMSKTEAKERIDALTHSASAAERKHIRISRRAVIAIVVAASLLIVSSAAAATSIFAREGYIPGRYIQKDADQRLLVHKSSLTCIKYDV